MKCVPWSDSIWIGAPQSGRIWFATTRATVFALLLRVGIASTYLENLSIITRQKRYPPLALGSGSMKSNWSNSQGPLGGSGLHSFVRPGLPWLMEAHTMHVSHHL